MDDKIIIDILVQMADLEKELVEICNALEYAQRRDVDLRELADEYAEDAAQADQQGQAATVNFRSIETEIRSLEARLVDRRDKLIGLTDRRQTRAIKDEILAMERRIDALETSAIDLLDQADGQQDNARQARDEKDRQQSKRKTELSDLKGQTQRSAAAEAEIRQELDRLLHLLPPNVAAHVKRLRRAMPTATSGVVSGACSGCFQQLPAQQAIQADKGKALIRCPGCARYVVHARWK